MTLPEVTVQLAVDIGERNPWVSVDPRRFLNGETHLGAQSFNGVTVRYEPGTARITLDNSGGEFDPTNLDGPYVIAGESMVRPMLGVRLLALLGGIEHFLFTGYVNLADISYEGREWSQVTLPCTDATKLLNNFNGLEQSPQGAGEDSGTRIRRIAGNAGLTNALLDLDVGKTTCQATTLAGNAWTEMLLTTDTEIGELYFTGEGKLRFRNRHAMLTEERSRSPQASFGDRPPDLPWDSVHVAYEDAQIRNRVSIARKGGMLQVAEDVASQIRYGADGINPFPRDWGRNDLLMETDEEALAYAQMAVYQNAEAELRFDQMVIDPTTDPDVLFPQVLGRQLGDRIAGRLHTPDGRLIERDGFIRGVHHIIGEDSWRTTWPLQSATKWSFFVLGDPVLGRLGFNALAY